MLVEEIKKSAEQIAAALVGGADVLIKYNKDMQKIKIQQVNYKKIK